MLGVSRLAKSVRREICKFGIFFVSYRGDGAPTIMEGIYHNRDILSRIKLCFCLNKEVQRKVGIAGDEGDEGDVFWQGLEEGYWRVREELA